MASPTKPAMYSSAPSLETTGVDAASHVPSTHDAPAPQAWPQAPHDVLLEKSGV